MTDLIRHKDAIKLLDLLAAEWREEFKLFGADTRFQALADGAIYARDAIRALHAVRVKPLVWKREGKDYMSADHGFGFYEIYRSQGRLYLTRNGADCGQHPTIKAAQVAAQADYEARLASCFE